MHVNISSIIFSSSSSSSSSAALQPGVGFGLLYKLIPLLSISSQLLPILHLDHLYIFEDFIDPTILGWHIFDQIVEDSLACNELCPALHARTLQHIYLTENMRVYFSQTLTSIPWTTYPQLQFQNADHFSVPKTRSRPWVNRTGTGISLPVAKSQFV